MFAWIAHFLRYILHNDLALILECESPIKDALKTLFLHIRPSSLTKPNDWDQLSICKNSPCVCACLNECEGWPRSLLVEWHYNLCRDKRVLIDFEKLECIKRVAHAICYVFLRVLSWRLESVLLAMSSHLQTSFPISSWKFTCGQVKD